MNRYLVRQAITKLKEIERELETLSSNHEKENMVYRVGARFIIDGHEYILAQVDYLQCALINLDDGNRYSKPVRVGKPTAITEKELNDIVNDVGAVVEFLEKGE